MNYANDNDMPQPQAKPGFKKLSQRPVWQRDQKFRQDFLQEQNLQLRQLNKYLVQKLKRKKSQLHSQHKQSQQILDQQNQNKFELQRVVAQHQRITAFYQQNYLALQKKNQLLQLQIKRLQDMNQQSFKANQQFGIKLSHEQQQKCSLIKQLKQAIQQIEALNQLRNNYGYNIYQLQEKDFTRQQKYEKQAAELKKQVQKYRLRCEQLEDFLLKSQIRQKANIALVHQCELRISRMNADSQSNKLLMQQLQAQNRQITNQKQKYARQIQTMAARVQQVLIKFQQQKLQFIKNKQSLECEIRITNQQKLQVQKQHADCKKIIQKLMFELKQYKFNMQTEAKRQQIIIQLNSKTKQYDDRQQQLRRQLVQISSQLKISKQFNASKYSSFQNSIQRLTKEKNNISLAYQESIQKFRHLQLKYQKLKLKDQLRGHLLNSFKIEGVSNAPNLSANQRSEITRLQLSNNQLIAKLMYLKAVLNQKQSQLQSLKNMLLGTSRDQMSKDSQYRVLQMKLLDNQIQNSALEQRLQQQQHLTESLKRMYEQLREGLVKMENADSSFDQPSPSPSPSPFQDEAM